MTPPGSAWRRFETSPVPPVRNDEADIVVVGGGPVGLTLALDLGRRGHRVVVLNRLDCIPAGSKAICFSKQSLETFDRLGVGDALVAQGVTWNLGKVFWGAGEKPVYEFDLLPAKDQKRPAFINLQQYRVEEHLVGALEALPGVDVRWGHEVVGVEPDGEAVELSVSSRRGNYRLRAEWTIACDGCRSPVRTMLGLDFDGQAFDDRFLIVDVKMDQPRPAERWFWFDPPFNPGGSALLHKQPDAMWRLDFQLDKSMGTEEALRPALIDRFVRGLLGPDTSYETLWSSLYSFQCRRMERFVHGRVIFAGDSAHVVSPFGARGCNGGIADAANLAWKLDRVLDGKADHALLETYSEEAIIAADENILNSTRSTDFIGPKTPAARALRDAVLQLAAENPLARPFVNSGRLASAVALGVTSLTTPDEDVWDGGIEPGSAALDAPLNGGWLLDALPAGFALLACDWAHEEPKDCFVLNISARDPELSSVRARYDLRAGSGYLLRPDRYVAARWRLAERQKVETAIDYASNGGRTYPRPPEVRPVDPDSLYARLAEAQGDADDTLQALHLRLILLLMYEVSSHRAFDAIESAAKLIGTSGVSPRN